MICELYIETPWFSIFFQVKKWTEPLCGDWSWGPREGHSREERKVQFPGFRALTQNPSLT